MSGPGLRRGRAARTAAATLVACCLAGCAGTYHFVAATPLCDRLAELEPGVTTQAEARARLGTPWSNAEAWGAEIYAGDEVYQDIVAVGLPVPAGKSTRPASLLVVYDARGVLSGAQYQGDGRYDCPEGATRHFRLVNQSGRGIGYERCAFEPLDAPPTLEGAREIFVPPRS